MTPHSARYLFGPATPEFALERLSTDKEKCLVLGADVPFEGCSSWQELQQRFPQGWQPDFVAFWSAYMDLPRCLLDAPVPLVLLAPDSNILVHAYAHLKDWFEIVLTDEPSIPLLKSLGYSQILGANFFGPGRSWFDKAPPPQSKRDVDLCFVGNLHPAVQRARLPWLGKIARLAPRRRVVIAAGVFGEAYQKLLRQSKIVFNLSVRSEFNLRVGEACASGALLLQEVWNAEVPQYLKPGVDYGVYDGDNLEEIIDYYLSSDAARCAVASRGQKRIQECSAPLLWDKQVQQIQELLTQLKEKALARAERAKQSRSDKGDPLRGAAKTWLLLGSNTQERSPERATDQVMSVESLACKAASTPDTQQALSLWEQVFTLVPNHPQALVAKTILLGLTQKPKEAVQFGMQVLEQLSKEPPPPESWLRQPGPFLSFEGLRTVRISNLIKGSD